jgi:glycosyltransferase involved in cell wall biosynthesis
MIAYTAYATDGRVRLEAESLVRWGYEVWFLVLKTEQRPRLHELCGVHLIELNVRKYRGKSKVRYLLSYLHFLILAAVACTSLFFRNRLRVVHVHNMPDLLVFAALIPRLLGCKVVLDIHDSVPETYAGKFTVPSGMLFRLLAFEERLCCAFADRVICVNHVQRDTIVRRGVPGRKVCTVITMPPFHRRPERPPMRDGSSFRLVNHGTISKRLGIDLLVRAAAQLALSIPGFELHLMGGGDDLEEVLQLVSSLGLSPYTHIHKGVNWDALPFALSPMDAGIVANRRSIATELMLPSKLIDYVQLGIPAVVPRLKAIEYYFSPEMVTYFEPEDVQSMVTAVLTLYDDNERRRTQAAMARRLFAQKYDWETHTDLRNLYAALCETAEQRTETGAAVR